MTTTTEMASRALALFVLGATFVACAAGAPATRGLGRPIDGDRLPEKVVILTYDDGPDEHTLEIARYLHDQDPPIHATFFVNGRRFCKVMGEDGSCLVPPDMRPCDDGDTQKPVAQPVYYSESLLDELIRLGHHVGNHTQDHCHLPNQHAASLVWEIRQTQELIERHGAAPFLFRAPYLEWNRKDVAFARREPALDKLRGPIDADLDGEDWDCWPKQLSIEQCGARYLELLRHRRRQNGIVLMHDRPEMNVGYDGPLRLTQWLVARLRQEGYQFGTIESLPVVR